MTAFTINVNGRDIPFRKGQTILQACRDNGIYVPSLCYEPRLNPLGTCRICTVEVEGPGLTISCSTMASEGMKVRTNSESVIAARRAKVEQLIADHYGDCFAPCHHACPAGIDIQGYVGLVARGFYQEALDLINESIPLPAVCGRVCPHPCESACRRSLVDSAIAINNLKRFVSDHGGAAAQPPAAPPSGKNVAVVGSGPAGLTAAHFLARQGHRVTILECRPLAGGMLRYGIPAYRLPKDILDSEINNILSSGVTLRTNQRLGKDFTISGLLGDGFNAVFLALGAGKSSRLNVPGENLEGVISGIDFLSAIASNSPIKVEGQVAVIGGGNTAVDAARSALRLGATEVTLLYRRSREQMPAISAEVEEAQQEGVRLELHVVPLRLQGANGRVDRLICERTRPGKPDHSGRPAPEPVPGSEFVLPFDSVIVATGQQPDLSCLDGDLSNLLKKGNVETVVADRETLATPVPGIFAGGDAVSGPSMAIEAIAAGKRAAVSIDAFLKGQPLALKKPFNSVKGRLEEIDKAEFAKIAASPRQAMPDLPFERRRGSFAETALGYSEAAARQESERCLQCGCSAIEKCTLRYLATEYGLPTAPARKDRYIFETDRSNPFVKRDDNKCVLCGLCARACRELIGAAALPTNFRLADGSQVTPLTKTNCITCGECTAVCPVGAMSPSRDMKPSRQAATICPHCSVGCGLILGIRGQALVSAKGDGSSPVSHGNLCFRGRFDFEFVNRHDRLAHPLVRREGNLVKATWEEALNAASAGLARYKGDSFAAIASGRITDEAREGLQRFTRDTMGSSNLYGPMGAAASADSILSHRLGSTHHNPSIADLGKSACLMVIGSDLFTTFPVFWLELRKAVQNGVTLIVIDPRETEAAKLANIWLKPRPGASLAVVNGITKGLIDEGLVDPAFAETHSAEVQALKDSLSLSAGSSLEETTDVTGDQATDAAYSLTQNKPAMIIFGADDSAGEQAASQLAQALADLALLTGNHGQPGSGLFNLIGQSPARPPDAGELSTEMVSAVADRRIKAAYVAGANPVAAGDSQMKEVFGQLEFLVVQDMFLTETASIAHVVLPSASFAETDGTSTNLEGRSQKFHAAISPIRNSKPDWEIVAEIASRAGGTAKAGN